MSDEVEYKVRDHANWQIPMDVTGAPDTLNPEVPSAGTVRPNAMGIGLFPNAQTGVWEISTVQVVGPKVKNGEVSTKRDHTVMFTDPLGPDSVAPLWVRKICKEWVDKANGRAKSPTKERNPYRKQFDAALKTLLLTEYREGAMWAIEKLREAAADTSDLNQGKLTAELNELAEQMESRVNMRVAELATED
jgi:hypothetical protein